MKGFSGSKKLLFKILRANLNPWLVVAFLLANIVGISIIIIGLFSFSEVRKAFAVSDPVFSDNYLIVSKPVSSLTTLSSLTKRKSAKTFSRDEIQSLSGIDGVRDAAGFTTSHFLSYGSVQVGGMCLSTELFFESIPDRFLDIPMENWKVGDDGVVPMVIPRNFLDIYNYGFAAANDMPQLGESLTTLIEGNVEVSGNGSGEVVTCRMVGCTDRINSILIPDSVLKRLNERYSSESTDRPVRLILKVDVQSLPEVLKVVENQGYYIEGGSISQARMASALTGALIVVCSIGLIFAVLSFFLLVVSIFLMMEKNRERNALLSKLGYHNRAIALPYQANALLLNVIATFAGIGLSLLAKTKVCGIIARITDSYAASDNTAIVLMGLIILLFFSVLYILLIKRRIDKALK